MPGVCAVIVTFNRLDQLKRCLESVQSQTSPVEAIVVVDNACTDGTRDFLTRSLEDDTRVIPVCLEENTGPAGGYARGLRTSCELPQPYVWVMDDDVIPADDCLEKQLEMLSGSKRKMIYPFVIDEYGRENRNPGWSALLLPREVIALAGVPIEELFWWAEDTEYIQWRLQRLHGVECLRAPSAMAKHGVIEPTYRPGWKYYYAIRNTIYYRTRIQYGYPIRRAYRLVRMVIRNFVRILLVEDQKIRKISIAFRGLYDGVRGQLGKTVDPATEEC